MEKSWLEDTLACAMCKEESEWGVLFQKLQIWDDPVRRCGPESMAVDEWLMTAATLTDQPILRFYEWEGDWASLGYFQSLAEARKLYGESVEYVRRWTGGGVVDHRCDLTYTLAIPKSEPMVALRGDASYRAIHEAVMASLTESGVQARFQQDCVESDSVACFEAPVCWDVMDGKGKKLAGAGQRRGKLGFLHQGSVSAKKADLNQLASFLAEEVMNWQPTGEDWRGLAEKYSTQEWLGKVL